MKTRWRIQNKFFLSEDNLGGKYDNDDDAVIDNDDNDCDDGVDGYDGDGGVDG